MPIEFLIQLIILGLITGFASGLLGIGGGGIMVPALTFLFIQQGVENTQVVHLSLGTSMTTIIVNSFVSMRAHEKHGNVIWPIVKQITPGIILGAYMATYVVAFTNEKYLAGFFACFMFYVAATMFLKKNNTNVKQLPGKLGMTSIGAGIGGISSLVSIGGGSLTVPYLVRHNVNIKKAVGTSAAIGFPIAIAGSLGYWINGLGAETSLDYTYGFIYVPAVIVVSLCGIFTVPIGARVAQKIAVGILKKVFALVLFALSLKMVLLIL